jgi:hypothetical protein
VDTWRKPESDPHKKLKHLPKEPNQWIEAIIEELLSLGLTPCILHTSKQASGDDVPCMQSCRKKYLESKHVGTLNRFLWKKNV